MTSAAPEDPRPPAARPGSAPLRADPVEQARASWVRCGWASAADGMAAVTSLMRAQQIVQARVDEVLRPLGLTFARYEVLMLLLFSSSRRLPMRVVSARLQVHPTSVTNAVDRLETAGLVDREPHPDDGRATLVVLSDTGRELALQATGALNERVFVAPGLPPDRVDALVQVLFHLRRDAGDFSG